MMQELEVRIETNQKRWQNNQGGVPVSTETVAATQETAMVF
jgi:hypothetical protein